jgi:hypothetical protein
MSFVSLSPAASSIIARDLYGLTREDWERRVPADLQSGAVKMRPSAAGRYSGGIQGSLMARKKRGNSPTSFSPFQIG